MTLATSPVVSSSGDTAFIAMMTSLVFETTVVCVRPATTAQMASRTSNMTGRASKTHVRFPAFRLSALLDCVTVASFGSSTDSGSTRT